MKINRDLAIATMTEKIRAAEKQLATALIVDRRYFISKARQELQKAKKKAATAASTFDRLAAAGDIPYIAGRLNRAHALNVRLKHMQKQLKILRLSADKTLHVRSGESILSYLME